MKERIDKVLVDLGYYDSRERAKKNIMAGRVFVDRLVVDKPGTLISPESNIEIKEDEIPFVSRGGLKLDKAIQIWDLVLEQRICMDIGASTGGFTDVMLKNGAEKVYAVDVGYGQLDWSLRNDARVVNLERTNIRHLTEAEVTDPIDFFSIDVSFISLRLVLPKLRELGKSDFECVALIKPQFEVGKGEVGKNGVVREPKLHEKAILRSCSYATDNELYVKGLNFSPIKGPKGNIEFLMLLTTRREESIEDIPIQIAQLVAQTHQTLNL